MTLSEICILFCYVFYCSPTSCNRLINPVKLWGCSSTDYPDFEVQWQLSQDSPLWHQCVGYVFRHLVYQLLFLCKTSERGFFKQVEPNQNTLAATMMSATAIKRQFSNRDIQWHKRKWTLEKNLKMANNLLWSDNTNLAYRPISKAYSLHLYNTGFATLTNTGIKDHERMRVKHDIWHMT